MKRFKITNDRYSNDPHIMTQEEMQTMFDELGWDVKLDTRAGGEELVDRNSGDWETGFEVVARLVKDTGNDS